MHQKLFYLALAFAGMALLLDSASANPAATITGVVVDEDEDPVQGATVRIQATTNRTTSAANGTFMLDGLSEGIPVTVSAWKEMYYCAKVEGVMPPASDIMLTLRLYQINDNPDYIWIPPAGPNSCYSCKPGVTQIWLDNDAHASAGNNPRFLSLYNGSDITGTATIYPGYKLDFPGTAGNCATCHAPAAAINAPFTTDMNLLTGIDRDFGVHCDFCHKVADVYLNPATGLPYNNAPGVLSMDVRRPFPESPRYQLFFGTFDDDNVPEEDTYLPLIQRSQWCAACHQFSFWGIPIYQSFMEWLESPYPSMGVECQTCHMPPDGVMTNVAPGFGGVERDPLTIHAHTMPGASSEELLQNTISMTLQVEPAGGEIVARGLLYNFGAGHHVPTDHPGRQLILVVSARDEQGQALTQTAGPDIPPWGGAQARQPGNIYAKVLQDVATAEYPVISYWKRTRILVDNRIPALGTAIYEFRFAVPAQVGEITVTAELLFRRTFQAEMDARAWDTSDILMEWEQVIIIIHKTYLPLVQ